MFEVKKVELEEGLLEWGEYCKYSVTIIPRAHVGNETIDSQRSAQRRVSYNHLTSASGIIVLLKTTTKNRSIFLI